jgi:acid phosphatase
MRSNVRLLALLTLFVTASPRLAGASPAMQVPAFAPEVDDPSAGSIGRIHHLVVIYLENRSFDHLYGEFPGADGLTQGVGVNSQRDLDGRVYATLPDVPDGDGYHFPASGLPNRPFALDAYVPAGMETRDLVHRFYQEFAQIDGGRMDHFAAVSDARALCMGYYHTAGLPLNRYASEFTLCDRFFHAAFGGSFLNHMWLIAAASPTFPNAPSNVVAQLDSTGRLVRDGFVTPDGYAVNTCYSVNLPHPSKTPVRSLVPAQTMPTIGDRLSEAGVSWAWYSGEWNEALAGRAHPSRFQYHHQPFAYFARYAEGTTGRADHLKDEKDFLAAIAVDSLPAVAFVKPGGLENEHPGYSNVVAGDRHAIELISAIQKSALWKSTLIVVTYDENGGFWDHVVPPRADRWGPGSRVPTIVISPFARRHHVDHTTYDTTSILAFIEKRWHVAPLSSRDKAADPLSGVLQP